MIWYLQPCEGQAVIFFLDFTEVVDWLILVLLIHKTNP